MSIFKMMYNVVETNFAIALLNITSSWLETCTLSAKANGGRKECQTLAIDGLGGIGKTQLALQFAYWVKDTKPDYSVFWVPAMSLGSFRQAYYEIGKKVGVLNKSIEEEDPREPIRDFLNSVEAGKWLLVLDNVDTPLTTDDGIYNYLPRGGTGSTVVTTRDRAVGMQLAGSHLITLPQMSQQDSEEMLWASLSRKEQIGDAVSTTKLLRKLTYLPLAIAQAAAYLNWSQSMTIEKYLKLLESEEDLAALMKRNLPDNTRYQDSENALALTWSVSFKQIYDKYRHAADLLCFISCIQPKAIPRSILPRFKSEEELENAIATLSGFAFLTGREDDEMRDEANPANDMYKDVMYDMHSLVHFATRQWVEYNEDIPESAIMRDTLRQVKESWAARGSDLWRLYLPHTWRLLSSSGSYKDSRDRYELYFSLGKCLSLDHRFPEARECYMQVLEQEKVFQEYTITDEPNDSLFFGLGNVFLAIGEPDNAEKSVKYVLETQPISRRVDDPRRLKFELLLARAYIGNGKAPAAITILEHIEEVQSTKLGPEDPQLLEGELHLGIAYLENGQRNQAVEKLEDTLEKYDGIDYSNDDYDDYETNHVMCQHWLGVAYSNVNRIEDAVDVVKTAMEMHDEVHEQDDPFRLSTLSLLVDLQANLSHLKEMRH
ncbi:phosphorylase superfamily protein [Apiospora arundinis]